MRRLSERECQGCVVSTGSKISNTVLSICRQEFFSWVPTEGGTPWDFPFSLSFTALARGLVTFFGRNFTLERSRGTRTASVALRLSLDTPTVAICFDMAKIVAVKGVRCASLTFLAPLLPRSQGPCILALRASDYHCHLEECFQTSVSREPRHRLIHRQSRRSLSRPANRSNVSIARDQEERTSECTCKGLNNRLDVKTMADNVNDARKSLRGFLFAMCFSTREVCSAIGK